MKNYLRLLIANVLLLLLGTTTAASAKEIELDFSVPNTPAVESVGMVKERADTLGGAESNRAVPIPTPTPEMSRQLARAPTAGAIGFSDAPRAMWLKPPPKVIANIALDFNVPDTSTVPSLAIARTNPSTAAEALPPLPPVKRDIEPPPTPPPLPSMQRPATAPPGKGKANQSSFAKWAPKLKAAPKSGDVVAGYPVTSPYGTRVHPITGLSQFHGGVDLATPEDTEVYAIGTPGTKTALKCWIDVKGGGLVASMRTSSFPNLQFEALHLSWCKAETNGPWLKVAPGNIIAGTGNTGTSTGPHLHFQVRDLNSGKKIAPAKGFISWALTGKQPHSNS
jgi:murein DD-endopeptidase MepM/ murein hydrolase activator NlpD